MENSLAFLITTYNREKSCYKLVRELTHWGDVYLINDGGEYDIHDGWVSRYPVHVLNQGHKGKEKYTETINTLFKMPYKKYDYYFMIQDDFLPVDGFVKKAIGLWDKIKSTKKICMMIYADQGRAGKPCWTKFKPVEYKDYWLTQWTDMNLMFKAKFLEEVGIIPRSKLNWKVNPNASSGVGAYISSTLYKAGWNLYQTKRSLLLPQPEAFKSEMNPWREKDDPINKPVL